MEADVRVVAVGGAGLMGSAACRLIAAIDEVEQLVVTDLSADVARRFAERLGGRSVGVGLDLTDRAALDAALSGSDVVVNAAGPFYRFGSQVLQAAIDHRCHYLDLCDDWEPTLEMLALDASARAAGVTAVVGLGASPGLTNLLAVAAARELDSCHEVITGWAIDGVRETDPRAGGEPNAAVLHGIRQLTGTIRISWSGEPVDERPLRRHDVHYPGLGTRKAVTFGHPEAVTLPRYLPGVASSVNVTHGPAAVLWLLHAISAAVDHHVLSPERAASTIERFERLMPAPRPHHLLDARSLPPLYALARGLHDGREASVGAALTAFPGTSMGSLTGTPLAVGVELLARGVPTPHGVSAPEGWIEPDAFFRVYTQRCLGAGDAYCLTRSWDPDAGGGYHDAIARARTSLESLSRT